MPKIRVPRKSEAFLEWARDLYLAAEEMHIEWDAPHPSETLMEPLLAWEKIIAALRDPNHGSVDIVAKANVRVALNIACKSYIMDYVINNPAVSEKIRLALTRSSGANSRHRNGERRQIADRRKNGERRSDVYAESTIKINFY